MKATIDFDENLYRRIKIEAARRGRTVRDLVSDAVRRFLDEPVLPTRESNEADWAPTWLGSLAPYADNAQDHSMKSVRESVMRGRASGEKP